MSSHTSGGKAIKLLSTVFTKLSSPREAENNKHTGRDTGHLDGFSRELSLTDDT